MRTRAIPPHAMLCTLLAVGSSTACSSWHTQPLAQVLAAKQPDAVRVVRHDGTRLVIDKPHATADSLVGTSGGKAAGVMLTEIDAVAVRRNDDGNTALLILGGVVLATVVIVGIEGFKAANEN